MKFLIDMPISPKVTDWLTHAGYGAVHAFHLGLGSASDTAIIEKAYQDKRVIITADLDYPRILALTKADGPGIILFRGGNYSEQEMLDLIQKVLQAIPLEDLPRSIVVVDKIRIRRLRLPIEPKL
jgi:predicted nuclease of predicted toxin-antitoxin system